MSKKIVKQNLLLLLVAILIVIAPLLIIRDSDFGGADEAASKVVEEINGEFTPWAAPITAPSGGETESLLFALQAALGAGVICYLIGYMKGRSDCTKANSREL